MLTALAIRNSDPLPRWSGIRFAAGFVLYLPQFFLSPYLRIAHGVLVGVGCVVLALDSRRPM